MVEFRFAEIINFNAKLGSRRNEKKEGRKFRGGENGKEESLKFKTITNLLFGGDRHGQMKVKTFGDRPKITTLARETAQKYS